MLQKHTNLEPYFTHLTQILTINIHLTPEKNSHYGTIADHTSTLVCPVHCYCVKLTSILCCV